MKKQKTPYLTHEGILVVNGKEYVESIQRSKKIDGIDHVDKQLFKEFDRKGFEKKIVFISDRIKETLDKDQLIRELVKKKCLSEIDNLYEILKEDKKKKKKITKQEGCIGVKIGTGKKKTGGAYLELID